MSTKEKIFLTCAITALLAVIIANMRICKTSGQSSIEEKIHLAMQDDTPLSERQYILCTTSKQIVCCDQEILWLKALAKLPRQAAIHVLQQTPNEPDPLSKLLCIEEKLDPETFNILKTLIPALDGSIALFNEKDFEGWKFTDTDNEQPWVWENGILSCLAYSNLRSEYFYGDFELSFEVSFEENSNNGVGFRAKGNQINEIQILDDEGSWHKGIIKDYQHHGSLYGVMPAIPGTLKPLGEWNSMEITIKGRRCIVASNGKTIVNGNMDESLAKMKEREDHSRSDTFVPLKNDIGELMFMGHDGPVVRFRNIRIKNFDPIIPPETIPGSTVEGF